VAAVKWQYGVDMETSGRWLSPPSPLNASSTGPLYLAEVSKRLSHQRPLIIAPKTTRRPNSDIIHLSIRSCRPHPYTYVMVVPEVLVVTEVRTLLFCSMSKM